MLAELGQLCGWAAYDDGQQGLAQRYYVTALRSAHSADHRPLGAHILSCLAQQATRQGRPAEAVTLIKTSCAGERLLRLGQADQAAVLIEESIALFDESFVRDRQLFSIHLANALSQPGKQRDLDAASRGMEAIRLVEGLDSNRSADLLRDLSHQLSPHTKVPAVRDFLERSREFAQA